MQNQYDIPHRLKALRERAGLSVREMARRVGMSSSGYSHYESADRFKDATLPLAQAQSFASAVKGTPVDPKEVLELAGMSLLENPIRRTVTAGFEETATPFEFSEHMVDPNDRLPHLRAIFGFKSKAPATYEIKLDLPAFALKAADIVLVDLSRLPEPGELAIVSVFDEQAASSVTTLCRYLPPYLHSGHLSETSPPMRVDHEGVTVRHPVIGSIRGIIRN